MKNNIRYLKRNEINDQQWDEVIAASGHSLPYAFTWYLDAVAENWDAAVWGNYEVVLPVVWMRKLGVRCAYQPYYCQQLGFFSKNDPDSNVASELMTLVTGKFSFANMNLNPSVGAIAGHWKLNKRKNLLLNLNPDYNQLRKGFSENHRRNMAKAEKAGLQFLAGMDLQTFQRFYIENVNREKENFKPKHEKLFKELTKALVYRNKAKIFAVISKDQKPLAEVMGIFHNNRIITIINSSSVEGKKNGAAHCVYNNIIKQYAGSAQLIDFEGSSVPSIARFYEGFGAQEEVFYNYKKGFLGH